MLPFGYSFFLSLTDWDVLSKINFLGLDNYINILKSSEFWKVLGNTLYYMVLYIPLILIVSLGLASLLNFKVPGRKVSFVEMAFKSLLWSHK
jgi:multiple sugar transport system permease protein